MQQGAVFGLVIMRKVHASTRRLSGNVFIAQADWELQFCEEPKLKIF